MEGCNVAKAKADTQRIYIRLDTGAVDLLGRLAPSAHKRGAYVSELIRRAAVEAGLIEPGTPGGTLDLTVLRHQLAAFEARYLDLQRRVEAALEAQEGGC
jgi:hypothetical protein